MNPQRYDLIVVGASFAGLACARRAAERGLHTLVLERQPEPGTRVHTTGLLVQEVVELLRPPPQLLRRIENVRLYAPSLRHADLATAGYGFYASDTPALLRWMAGTARAAGAELRCATPFRDAYRSGTDIMIPDLGLRARYLVGADGPLSRVAQRFELDVNRDFLIGVEAECAGIAVPATHLHCLVDSNLAPGYLGWLFRGVGDIVQLGLATRLPCQPDLDALVARFSQVLDLRLAVRLGRRGGLIPVGGPLKRWHAPGVLLIGDAAGLVSPLTAGGIHRAVHSGLAAADAVADELLHAGPDAATALRKVWPRDRGKRLLRRLLDLRPPNAAIEAGLLGAGGQAFARRIYFGSAATARSRSATSASQRASSSS